MMTTSNQQGFSAIEGLLILVVLGIIGFTGWFGWHSKQVTNKDYATNPSIGTSNASIKTFADCKKAASSVVQLTSPEICVTKSGQRFTSTSQVATPHYITFTQWGVKASLNTSLYLQYSISGDTATFTSKELVAADTACSTYGGTIERVKPADNYSEDASVQQTAAEYASKLDKASSTKQYALVNGYYYFFQHDQSGCSNNDQTVKVQDQTNDAVQGLVPTLVAE